MGEQEMKKAINKNMLTMATQLRNGGVQDPYDMMAVCRHVLVFTCLDLE